MTTHFIAVTPEGKHRVYRVVNGLYRYAVGPAFATPKEAARYVDSLDTVPTTSPLRVPSEPSAPSPSVPSLAGLDLDGSDGPRERGRRQPPGE
jgi:hypothetical protein